MQSCAVFIIPSESVLHRYTAWLEAFAQTFNWQNQDSGNALQNYFATLELSWLPSNCWKDDGKDVISHMWRFCAVRHSGGSRRQTSPKSWVLVNPRSNAGRMTSRCDHEVLRLVLLGNGRDDVFANVKVPVKPCGGSCRFVLYMQTTQSKTGVSLLETPVSNNSFSWTCYSHVFRCFFFLCFLRNHLLRQHAEHCSDKML